MTSNELLDLASDLLEYRGYAPVSKVRTLARGVREMIEERRDDEITAKRKPHKPDQIRVDRGDWIRASGLTLCETCGCCYFDHATVVGIGWLNRLCDGRLVKL